MTPNRDLDPFTAEQLLSGAAVDGEVGPLADLLAAAAAAPRADELTGEAAAVAAFRDATGPAGTVPGSGRGVGRLLGLKVAIAVAAVAGAGVAGAAAAGLLGGDDSAASVAAPTSVTPSSTVSRPATGTSSTSPPEQAGGKDDSPHPSTSMPKGSTKPRHPTTPKPTHRPTQTRPSDQVISMCKVYLAFAGYEKQDGQNPYGQPRNDRNYSDQMLDSPYFQPMVRAAGGKDKVPAYCKRVVKQYGNSQGNRAPAIAPPPDRSDRPSGRPTSDPTSRPAASQTGTATTALPPPRGR